MTYHRQDIEGLRAIAVILVILFHYGFWPFSGGFIGVDVFFVISGYVITELLGRNIKEQRFRFSEFYRRRILRLVPAFLLVSGFTFIMISPFYMDDDYYFFSKSWLASLVGLSNIFYYQELSQYFSADTHVISLLHTWSLAVEEQYYLLWPTLMILLHRSRFELRQHAVGFGVFWLAFFAISVYLAATSAKAAYYLLPARVFELMLGAGLSLYRSQLPGISRGPAELLSLTGLLMIVATAIGITHEDHFPGYNAFWPTFGTVLLIYVGLHQKTFITRCLQTRPLVFIGSISYGLYLWHWPPIALANYQLFELLWWHKLALVAAVTILSWLSYRFVENRLRYADWSLKKAFLLLICAPAIVIWLVQVTIRINDDISFRMPEAKRELYRILQQNKSSDLFKSCFKGDFYQFDQSKNCVFGDKPDPTSIDTLLIGDSHAVALIGFVEKLIDNTGRNLLLVTQASTPFMLPELTANAFNNNEEKILRNKALKEYLTETESKTVVVAGRWDAYLDRPGFRGYFMESFQWIVDQGHRLIIIEDAPILPSDSHAFCLLKTGKECTIEKQHVDEIQSSMAAFKKSVKAQITNVEWLQPANVVCDDQQCRTVLDGIPLYRDESHLNYLGAQKIGDYYLQHYSNPLKSKNITDPQDAARP